jgi:hypothetical protein
MDREVVFPEKWTAPKELTRALPRETKLTGRGLFNVILAVIFLMASIGLAFWLRNEAARDAAHAATLHVQGQQATGEITTLWHKDRGRVPMVAYAFSANGARIHGESQVPDSQWTKLQKAGFLPVLYLPSNPSVNHPAGWDERSVPDWFPIALPLVWVFGAAFLLFNLRRQGRVAAEGVPAAGVVTRCYRVKGGWAARYQFKTKDGAIVKGRDKMWRKFTEGAPVCVLYLPDNPRRNNLYPLCLYTISQ